MFSSISELASGVRYIFNEIQENYNDPEWWTVRFRHRVVAPIHSVYPGYQGSVRVMEEDWDNLIVLDACRVDLFQEVADLDRFDAYDEVTSSGSSSEEWAEQNFAGREFGDTIYVSANPYITKVANDCFHELIEVWKDSFDTDLNTVRPEDVVDAAIDAYQPDKRLIVHFMQPHHPFIGHQFEWNRGWSPEPILGIEEGADSVSPWKAPDAGLVAADDVWQAYADNLRLGLDAAFELIDAIEGKTVITSDHGNLMGERLWPVPMRGYAHPREIRHPMLVQVPWAVVDGTKRREIVSEGINTVEADEEELQQRLRDLGYV